MSAPLIAPPEALTRATFNAAIQLLKVALTPMAVAQAAALQLPTTIAQPLAAMMLSSPKKPATAIVPPHATTKTYAPSTP